MSQGRGNLFVKFIRPNNLKSSIMKTRIETSRAREERRNIIFHIL